MSRAFLAVAVLVLAGPLPAYGADPVTTGAQPTAAPTSADHRAEYFRQLRLHPNDAKGWRTLATTSIKTGDYVTATAALARYTALEPHDGESLEELGGLYLRQADQYAQQYVTVQTLRSVLMPSAAFMPPPGSPLAQALTDPIYAAIATRTSETSQAVYLAYLDTQRKAVGVYRQIVTLYPKDPTSRFRLAQVAQAAGDNADAVTAYRAFLALAPHDSLAPAARKALNQLQAAG